MQRIQIAQRSSQRRGRAPTFFAGGVVGGLVAYLFDPDRGRQRRRTARDRTGAGIRRATRRAGRRAWAAVMAGRGQARRLVHRLAPPAPPQLDDVELAHKVESILFRNADVPKGRLSINAERGVVFLRGQVDRPDLVEELEKRVRKIPGVSNVENLLHLPGTPAPASGGQTKAPRTPAD
jgi:hypothetical protein